jgi:hypothetical protein
MPKKVTRVFAVMGDPNGYWDDGLQSGKDGYMLYKSVYSLLEGHGIAEIASKLPAEWQEQISAFGRGEIFRLQLPACCIGKDSLSETMLVSFKLGA